MRINGIGVLCGMVLILAGCGGENKNKLVVYSPHGKELLGAYEKAFEAKNPGVDVQWIDMGSQNAYDRIRVEGKNPQADVWFGGPQTLFMQAADEGLLEPYEPAWSKQLAPEFHDAKHRWYGTYQTPEVIAFNTHKLTAEEAPADWDDLLDPKWKDQIIVRYPIASGTMRTIFCAMILRPGPDNDYEAGFDWLRRLDANTKTYTADPTQMYIKLAREEGLVTLWNMPDIFLQKKNGYPFDFIIPKSGTPVLTEGIAIVKNARHPDLAKAFYDFVTSKESMIQAAEQFDRIPTRTDIEPELLPDWITQNEIKAMPLDWKLIAEKEKAWMEKWDQEIKGQY